MNTYEIPEVVELDKAHKLILGAKLPQGQDIFTGDEVSRVVDLQTDIDE